MSSTRRRPRMGCAWFRVRVADHRGRDGQRVDSWPGATTADRPGTGCGGARPASASSLAARSSPTFARAFRLAWPRPPCGPTRTASCPRACVSVTMASPSSPRWAATASSGSASNTEASGWRMGRPTWPSSDGTGSCCPADSRTSRTRSTQPFRRSARPPQWRPRPTTPGTRWVSRARCRRRRRCSKSGSTRSSRAGSAWSMTVRETSAGHGTRGHAVSGRRDRDPGGPVVGGRHPLRHDPRAG